MKDQGQFIRDSAPASTHAGLAIEWESNQHTHIALTSKFSPPARRYWFSDSVLGS